MALYALGELTPTIDPTAYIHPDAVVIGDVRIGARSSVWPSAVLRGDDGHIIVGARTSIQDGSVIHTTAWTPTTIGDDCVIGHLVHLEGCTVEDGALVGNGSIVLHNAVVRRGAIVGAGAVVPNNMEVASGAIARGVPARIKPDAVRPGMIDLPAASYVERAARYPQELRRLD
jgi:carbonic anhydrase/acetyltransferase-like protein (isoleucine patch superfamily)